MKKGLEMGLPLRLLLVEDSEGDARLLLMELRRNGYEPAFERVETASAMRAALEREPWDAVLSDHKLPRFSSTAALEVLQELSLDLPFIIVSGVIGEETAVPAMKAGAHDYILKDNLARLVPGIERELREAEVRRKRREAEEALEARAQQQAAIAELGQQALGSTNLSALFDESVAIVAQVLDTGHAKVLELLPGGDVLLLRAGVGWKQGLVGRATVDTGTDSQAGWTLLSNEPVIVEDLERETRFKGPPLLRDHGIVSGMSVIIQGRERPLGVLGVHTRRRRTFTRDDIHFLQAAAHVLATAIERKDAEDALRNSEARKSAILTAAPDGIITFDEKGVVDSFNPAAEAMLHLPAHEVIGRDVGVLLDEPDAKKFRTYFRWYLETGDAQLFDLSRELTGRRKDGGAFPMDMTVSETRIEGRRLFTGIIRDLTDQRAMEAQLFKAQKMEITGIIARGTAHDFGNLLATIQGNLFLALNSMRPRDPGFQYISRLG